MGMPTGKMPPQNKDPDANAKRLVEEMTAKRLVKEMTAKRLVEEMTAAETTWPPAVQEGGDGKAFDRVVRETLRRRAETRSLPGMKAFDHDEMGGVNSAENYIVRASPELNATIVRWERDEQPRARKLGASDTSVEIFKEALAKWEATVLDLPDDAKVFKRRKLSNYYPSGIRGSRGDLVG